MSHKVFTLTVQVPHKRAGNIIVQQEVSFDVYAEGKVYKLVPLLNEDERRIANLPEALRFYMQGGKPVSLRGIKDGNFHVITDAVTILRQQNFLFIEQQAG